MSAKDFQTLVNQVKTIIDVEFGILNFAGNVIACSNEANIGNKIDIQEILDSDDTLIILNGASYRKIYSKGKIELITYIKANDSNSLKYIALFSISVENIKSNSVDKSDKTNFIKNIITDNILPWDIQIKAKELQIEDTKRVVLLIKSEQKAKTLELIETIQQIFDDSSKDFVVLLDEDNVVLIKEINNDDNIEINNITNKILTSFSQLSSPMKVIIGVGTVFENVINMSRSFKEAQMALLIGGIFESDKQIISYTTLGIGRLIYQLPITLCKLFLQEVFKEGSIESLDQEMIETIQKFFENSLNVSETSRQLYIHRNTLVYRLDKILNITGMDLRKFDDAITFKVAMLVKKYLEKNKDMIT